MKKSILIVAAVLSVGAAQASTLNFVGMKAGQYKQVTINYNGHSENVYAGTMNIKVDGVSMDAYCVDLDDWNHNGDTYGVNELPISALGSNSIPVGNLFAHYSQGVDSANKGAALQLAIWDALVDGGDGMDTGQFKASGLGSTLSNLTNSYLTEMGNAPQTPFDFKYFEAVSHQSGNSENRFQNLLTGQPVPEPVSMVALAFAGAAAFARRRRA